MGVNSLPKTVTRQRRGCDLNPGPSAPEFSMLTTGLPSHPVCKWKMQFDRFPDRRQVVQKHQIGGMRTSTLDSRITVVHNFTCSAVNGSSEFQLYGHTVADAYLCDGNLSPRIMMKWNCWYELCQTTRILRALLYFSHSLPSPGKTSPGSRILP